MIWVETPPGYGPERRYACEVLLREFLGLDCTVQEAPRRDVALTVPDGGAHRELRVADLLFQTPPERWLTPSSLPGEPLDWWDLAADPVDSVRVADRLPVLYGQRLAGGSYVDLSDAGAHGPPDVRITLGLDLFGSAFFLLTRYEEVAAPRCDARERFPATASIAHSSGFLDRPVVNEYLEILWWALRHLWPRLSRKPRRFQVHLTHDVDDVLCTAGRPPGRVLRTAAGDLLKRGSPRLALRRLRSYAAVRRGRLDADLCNTFDLLMTLSEERGLRSAFYFIADHTGGAIDGTYGLDDPFVRRLLRHIHARGHEIGLHPSYHTFRDPAQIVREFRMLRAAAEAEGIVQERWGGRQHYLRWEAPSTWQAWEDAGLDYDSTLSFADQVGFRCGTCYEYPAFNLRTRTPLRLRERPLTVMEATVLEYMGLPRHRALQAIATMRERCRLFAGDFTLLWHNARLIDDRDLDLYRRVLAGT